MSSRILPVAGKVLQFSYYKEKAKARQQYSSLVADVRGSNNVGVLCTRYLKSESEIVHTLPPQLPATNPESSIQVPATSSRVFHQAIISLQHQIQSLH